MVYETDGFHLSKATLDADIHTNLKDVLGDQKTESYLTRGAGANSAIFHGHGGKNKEIDLDTEKFFRYVDKVMIEKVSKHMNYPIFLVGLNKNQAIYRELSNHPNLQKANIELSYESLSEKQLLEHAHKLIKPMMEKRINELVHHYQRAQSSQKTSDHINDIVLATVNNEIDTLFIAAEQGYKGVIDWNKKEVYTNKNHEDTDVFDEIAEVIIRNGGNVFVFNQEYMPTTSGICAIIK